MAIRVEALAPVQQAQIGASLIGSLTQKLLELANWISKVVMNTFRIFLPWIFRKSEVVDPFLTMMDPNV